MQCANALHDQFRAVWLITHIQHRISGAVPAREADSVNVPRQENL